MELGTLKSLPARLKFTSEAREFTPWLATNLNHLSEAIGLELELEKVEIAVGPYAADILAKETVTGKYVVIENQLEKTNHDHLGKAITYSSVLDAAAIVWIATEFTEEHKKALDWLNDHTDEDISFYGVQLELWQIDDSKPAIKFHVISKPNQPIRQAAKAKATEDLSESKRTQLEFWTNFAERLLKTRKIVNVQTPRPQYWFAVSLGKSNIHLSNTCNTEENKVGIRVYISNKIADSMLPYLESKKELIESEVGQILTWNPNPNSIDKTITLTYYTDFNDPSKVNDAVDWLVEYTLKFREVFSKILKEFVIPTL